MRYPIALAALALWLLAAPVSALAQSSEEIRALRTAIDALRESQQRLERDVAAIKNLLRAMPAAAPAPAPDDEPKDLVLSMEGDHTKGDTGAKLVLVDFTDYQ
ncbi:MAG TPA: hypothetical protein VLT62_01165 [Candidatus Methylomirabilis sp.]|nr:hypothetical protein [Candidatus Methylomirabilis sp.]